MSRVPAGRLLAAMAFAILLLCARIAFASADDLESLLAGALVPSKAPSLLAPIGAEGRTGWECRPERAAAATEWKEAQLPATDATP